MDLSKFDTKKKSDEGVWMEILAPDESGEVVCQFKVAGKDSKIMKRQTAILAKKGNKKKVSIAEQERETYDLLVACTLDWKELEEKGKEVPFSSEKAREYYEAYPWLAEQVLNFIGDRANFL